MATRLPDPCSLRYGRKGNLQCTLSTRVLLFSVFLFLSSRFVISRIYIHTHVRSRFCYYTRFLPLVYRSPPYLFILLRSSSNLSRLHAYASSRYHNFPLISQQRKDVNGCEFRKFDYFWCLGNYIVHSGLNRLANLSIVELLERGERNQYFFRLTSQPSSKVELQFHLVKESDIKAKTKWKFISVFILLLARVSEIWLGEGGKDKDKLRRQPCSIDIQHS